MPLHPPGTSPSSYRGHNVTPVQPLGAYAVNGVVLDTQPAICTAPTSQSGLSLTSGDLFELLFDTPSLATQNAFPNGSSVSLTFATRNGRMVTGQVRVMSTLIYASVTYGLRALGPPVLLTGVGASTFVVTCTLLSGVTPSI